MKKLLFATLLAIIPCIMMAQSKSATQVRYRGDVGLHIGSSIAIPFGGSWRWLTAGGAINTTHGVEINNALTIGAGVALGAVMIANPGWETFEPGVAVSFYGHLDYAFAREKKVRPFIAFRGGYGGSAGGYGPNAGLGFGIRINNRWDIDAWYRAIYFWTDGKPYLTHAPFIGFAWRFPGDKKPRA